MSRAPAFEPHWASPPGETVLAVLDSKGKTVEDLADSLGISDADARGLVTGATTVTQELASGLASQLGASPGFWLNREENYRSSLHWLSVDEIASALPVQHMIKYGWIENSETWKERARACLGFFDVADVEEWKSIYGEDRDAGRYRASTAFGCSPAALAAWIRQGERLTQQAPSTSWSRSTFLALLPDLRRLTKDPNPQRFIPALRSACLTAGVNVVVLRAPDGVPVSGVARQDRSGRPMILLSARHLTDDHFWFTFFHEAAHVVLHDLAHDFVDSMDDLAQPEDSEENEANELAQDLLFPSGLTDLTASTPRMREVVAYAASMGVAPGIVVGQLQHKGVLQYNQLNRLRRRYRWDGPSLRI